MMRRRLSKGVSSYKKFLYGIFCLRWKWSRCELLEFRRPYDEYARHMEGMVMGNLTAIDFCEAGIEFCVAGIDSCEAGIRPREAGIGLFEAGIDL